MDDPSPIPSSSRPTHPIHRTSSVSSSHSASLRPRPAAVRPTTSFSSTSETPSTSFSPASQGNHSSSSLEPIHDFHAPPPHPPLHQGRARRASRVNSMRSFVTVNREEWEGGGELRPPPGSPGFVSPPATTATPKSETTVHSGSGSSEDPYVVCFQKVDAGDPRQWRNSKRWSIMVGAAFEMTCGTLAISLFTSGNAELSAEFGVSREVVIVGTTLYLTALAISSLVTAPLGEMYGRRPVMIFSFLFFTLFSLGVGLAQNIQTFLVLRFLSGLCGSAAMSHGPAMANDLFAEHEIGLPLTLAGVGRFGGPTIGPLIGGYIAQYAGWRWLAHTQTLFCFSMFLLALFVIPETYTPQILRARAGKLAKEIGAHHITAYESGRKMGGWGEELVKYLVRPFLYLTCEPIVLLLSLHVSFLYGILNLYFSAYPIIFVTERGWSQGNAGLPFIACLVGFVVSVPFAIYASQIYARAASRSPTGRAAPEERLWFGIFGAGLLPISLFWLGWSARKDVHWMAPTSSGVLFGTGQLALTMSVLAYFSDTYQYQMGSVLAGSNFLRFAFGGIFPLFSNQMFQKLGAGWALSLLGFLCLVFFPAPILFYVYGERIRRWSKFVPSQGGVGDTEKDVVEVEVEEEGGPEQRREDGGGRVGVGGS